MAESEWLARIKADSSVFSEVFQQYYHPIFSYIFRRTGNFDDAADIAAETFLNAFRHIHRFNYRGISIKVWLYRIATNEINLYFRHRRKKNSQEALSNLIIRGKRKIALSLWWLSVPVFVIAALLMEQFYKPGLTLWSSIRKLKNVHSAQTLVLLLFLPLIVSGIQFLQLRQFHFFTQSPWMGRTKAIWLHLLIIFLSLIIIIIYLCN